MVVHPTRAGVEQAQCVAEAWLSGMGLHLKASNTRIGHTLHAIDGHGGSDCLGFAIRHYPTGKTRPGHDGRTPRPYKRLINPRTAAGRRPLHALRAIVRAHKAAPHMALIVQLNPVMRGWTMYDRAVVAQRIVAACDYHLMATRKHGAGRRHGHKSVWGVFDNYWRRSATGRLAFATPDGLRLVHHADTSIRRHVKVRGVASPYDGNLRSWAQRRRAHPLTTSRMTILLKRPRGVCLSCGLLFTDRDIIEVDHVIPRVQGGAHDLANLQALHRHCHDQTSAHDGSLRGCVKSLFRVRRAAAA